MKELNADMSIHITNNKGLQIKCERLSELFAEAGKILGEINSGTTLVCENIDEKDENAPKYERGKHFEYADMEWVALDEVDGGILAVTAECLTDTDGELDEFPFDKNNKNDWSISTLRKYLNGEFLRAIGADNLIKQTLDLTADDGMRDYGTSEDYIGILSCEQYRKHRDILPDYDCLWWTLTPWTCLVSHSDYVRTVNTSGYVYSVNATHAYGAAPTCIFKREAIMEAL